MVPLDQSFISSCVTAAMQPYITYLQAPPATAVTSCLLKAELGSDSDDDGTGMDLDGVESGGEEDVFGFSPSTVTTADSDAASDAAADAFCDQMLYEQDKLVYGAEIDAHEYCFSWQHERVRLIPISSPCALCWQSSRFEFFWTKFG
jgi:hypothetical protein